MRKVQISRFMISSLSMNTLSTSAETWNKNHDHFFFSKKRKDKLFIDQGKTPYMPTAWSDIFSNALITPLMSFLRQSRWTTCKLYLLKYRTKLWNWVIILTTNKVWKIKECVMTYMEYSIKALRRIGMGQWYKFQAKIWQNWTHTDLLKFTYTMALALEQTIFMFNSREKVKKIS